MRKVLAEEPKLKNRHGRRDHVQALPGGPLSPLDWQPRAEDWGPTTLLAKHVRTAIDAAEETPVLAYPTTEDDFESFRTFVQAASIEAAFTCVVLKGGANCTELEWAERRSGVASLVCGVISFA